MQVFSTTKEKDIAITNSKSKPKFSTAKQVSDSLINTSSRAANKAIQGYAKHQSKINESNNLYLTLMEGQQSTNFMLAKMELGVRRMERIIQAGDRFLETGVEAGFIDIAIGWIIDHALFVLDLIWGFIQPILLMILMLILQVVVIIVCTAIGIYLLFLFISSVFN